MVQYLWRTIWQYRFQMPVFFDLSGSTFRSFVDFTFVLWAITIRYSLQYCLKQQRTGNNIPPTFTAVCAGATELWMGSPAERKTGDGLQFMPPALMLCFHPTCTRCKKKRCLRHSTDRWGKSYLKWCCTSVQATWGKKSLLPFTSHITFQKALALKY